MNDIARIETIEQKIDKTYASEIAVSAGGVQITSMKDVMEMAKLMAVSAQAVPPHLRGQPGMCLGICIQAIEWKMSPFAVANKSYVVNDRLAYESQLIHSVIEARAPIVGRLRCRYDGDGEDLTCTVYATFKGETEPHEYTSPKVRDIKVKNSPLWKSDVPQQLWYYASRSWARKWCPDVLLGIYTPEEAEQFEIGDHAKNVSPNLMDRLPGRMSDNGFKPDVVQTGLADQPRAKKGRRKGETAQPVNIVPPAETTPSEPSPQAAGPSIPAPDAIQPQGADSPAAPSSPSGAGTRTPESASEYIVYAEHWISRSPSGADAYQRWDNDMGLRDELQVPIKDRNALLRKIEEKFRARA